MKTWFSFKIEVGGDDSEIFKIFTVSAATAVIFPKKSAAVAAQPIGLHL